MFRICSPVHLAAREPFADAAGTHTVYKKQCSAGRNDFLSLVEKKAHQKIYDHLSVANWIF